MDIQQIQQKGETKTVTLKIQQTPLQDKNLKQKIMSQLHNLQNKGTYYTQNNKIKQHSQVFNLTGNSFFDAFYAAYCLHGDVMISSNDIWLTICHQFGKEINKNPEKYRDLFVSHEGKQNITIYVDGTKQEWMNFPCQENRWDLAFDEFSKEISRKTKGDVVQLMKNDFSTSKMVEQSAANICIMSQMKNYFNYKMMVCGCGIQNVHFEGGVEDFEYLSTKIKKLVQSYSLNQSFKSYLSNVQEIVDTFVDQMKDSSKVDVNFWNRIFDEKSIPKYGPSGIKQGEQQAFSGWINRFFGVDTIIQKDVPEFSSKAPVLAKDDIKKSEYNLQFITTLKGIEEVENNIFRPITFINVELDKKDTKS